MAVPAGPQTPVHCARMEPQLAVMAHGGSKVSAFEPWPLSARFSHCWRGSWGLQERSRMLALNAISVCAQSLHLRPLVSARPSISRSSSLTTAGPTAAKPRPARLTMAKSLENCMVGNLGSRMCGCDGEIGLMLSDFELQALTTRGILILHTGAPDSGPLSPMSQMATSH